MALQAKKAKVPSSVYRLQFNKNLTLKKAIELIDYLSDLGIEGIYCSPIFECMSTGYDVLNPNRLNADLGSLDDWSRFCDRCREKNISLILDIVPNHMSIKDIRNLWWTDVLEKGPDSAYADFFDINWNLNLKILLPILESSYGSALENQKIQLVQESGKFWIRYADYKLPVIGLASDTSLKKINGTKGDPNSFNLLHDLLEKQHYRLAYWRVAGDDINYRRFFNINDLVAIHTEKLKVFQAYHQWIISLIETNAIFGVRIDHPDGLYDPVEYFERIEKIGTPLIVVEKILEPNELLPQGWEVDGTVGYEFLALLNGLFIEKSNEDSMTKIYETFIEKQIDFKSCLYERKKRFILLNMGSEVSFLGSMLKSICEKNRFFRDFTHKALTAALEEIIASFPVYRTYIRRDKKVNKRDRGFITQAIESAKEKSTYLDASIFQMIQDVLLFDYFGGEDQIDFVLRFQQITAPTMARGLEDSVFYIYNRLIPLSEVGSDPQIFGNTIQQFHEANKEKLKKWPLGFLATSTHDTKYSEDARMRMAILSEIPLQWQELLQQWSQRHSSYKTALEGISVPEANTEYYIYQLLIGLWPDQFDANFTNRFCNIIRKVIREAGLFTSWRDPDEKYENAVLSFTARILSEDLTPFSSIAGEISKCAKKSSLSQLLLKIGSCGIVDIYQGNEYYQFLAMDPDNRGTIDYNQAQDQKYFITKTALQFRRAHNPLFIWGDYIPLNAGKHVIAFARKLEKKIVVIAVQRLFCNLKSDEDKVLTFPQELNIGPLKDIFSQTEFQKKSIEFEKLFASWPVALLEGEIL